MTYLNVIFLNSLGFVYELFHFSTDQKELRFWALVAWYLIVSMISVGHLTLILRNNIIKNLWLYKISEKLGVL